MKLTDTQLPAMYSSALYEEKYLNLAPEHLDKMYDVLFTGTANLLSNAKSKDRPASYTFYLDNGVFVAGAVIKYFPNADDANSPGNWSLVWTFDEADIPADGLKMSIADTQTHSYFISAAGEKYGIQYKNESAIVTLLTYSLSQLKKWLDQNAKTSEEVTVECDGIFVARVGVENGEKVFSIEPAGEIKNLIKDDAAIEK